MRPQAERSGLTLSAQLDPATEDAIEADPDLILRALLNLLQNAIKFTPQEGTIEVFTATDDLSQPAQLWIHVRDSGIGVDPAEQSRIFQRFYRIDRARAMGSGTGLGLAVVRHIAEVHGGAVSLESEPGRGSTFGFSVPRSADVSDATEANSLTTP